MKNNVIENLERAAHTRSLEAVYGDELKTKRPFSPKLTDPSRMKVYTKNLVADGERDAIRRYVMLCQELEPLELPLPDLSQLL